MRQHVHFLLISFILGISLSCNDSNDEPEYLQIDTSTIILTSEQQNVHREIKSNTQWTVTPSSFYEWITISPETSSGNGNLTISVASNQSESDRYAYFKISSAQTPSRTLCVRQGGTEKTDSHLPAPDGLSIQKRNSQIILSWEAVENATEYTIHRSSNTTGIYDLIGKTATTSFTTSPAEGDNYYKVKAHNQNEESAFSPYIHYDNNGNDEPDENEKKPAAPTGVSVTNRGNDLYPNLYISWTYVSNATSYKVYRSNSSYGTYTLLGETSYTYYYDSTPQAGKNYYKITAVNNTGESSYSEYSYYNYDTSSSLVPATPQVSVSGSSSLNITWTTNNSTNYGKAQKYEVYKRNPETSDFELLTTTTSTRYTDNSPHPGINRYGVVAVNDAGKSAIGIGYSPEIPLSRPTGFKANKSGSNITFSWNKVRNATGYQIFSATSASGNYYILSQIDSNTSTQTVYYPASSGTTVYFKIKAVYSTPYGGSPVYSDFSSYTKVSY